MALHANPFGQIGGLLPSVWQVSSASGANTALSNLASVAINTSLVSDTDLTDDLGSTSVRWNTVWAGFVNTTQLILTDTDVSDTLSILCGSNLTAGRTLTILPGDADRTLTIGANSSISGTAYVVGGTDVVVVADGGTGVSAFTAYMPICGGTTTTGTLQSVVTGAFGQSLSYVSTSALPVFKGTMTLLSTATATSDATVDFTMTAWTNSGFAAYLVVLANVAPETDNVSLYLRTSSDGGSTFAASASDYRYAVWQYREGGTAAAGSAGAAQIFLNDALGNNTNESTSGHVLIYRPSAAAYCKIEYNIVGLATDGSTRCILGGAQRVSAADVNAIRFLFSSGDIGSGEFRLYGLSNA